MIYLVKVYHNFYSTRLYIELLASTPNVHSRYNSYCPKRAFSLLYWLLIVNIDSDVIDEIEPIPLSIFVLNEVYIDILVLIPIDRGYKILEQSNNIYEGAELRGSDTSKLTTSSLRSYIQKVRK